MKCYLPAATAVISSFLLLTGGCKDSSSPVDPGDYSPPAVRWIAPEAGSLLSDTVLVRLNFFDESGVDSVKLLKDGAVVYSQRISPSRVVADPAKRDRAIHSRVVADPAKRDRAIPPRSDGGVSSPQSVVAQSALTGRTGNYAVESAVQGVVEYLWDTRADSDGVHIWEALAWDAAGNQGRSNSLLVRVLNHEPPVEDRLPPDLWWDAPDPGATLQDTVLVRLNFFDESGVDSVKLLKDGAVVYSQRISPSRVVADPAKRDRAIHSRVVADPAKRARAKYLTLSHDNREFDVAQSALTGRTGNYAVESAVQGVVEYLWNTLADSDGVHIWEALAWDAAGNQGRSNALLVRVLNHEPPAEDHTPPVITWLFPTPGDTLEGTVVLRFQVLDDVAVDSVWLWVNGSRRWSWGGENEQIFYEIVWTIDKPDGMLYIGAEAVDAVRNRSFTPPIGFYVWNNRPRVLWVPDDYETIQGAINASNDGDTVRVRAGVYREGVRIYRPLWVESAEGPDVTIIDTWDQWFGILFAGETLDSINCVFRGFTIRSSGRYPFSLSESANARVVNNIIESEGTYSGNVYFGSFESSLCNNVFVGASLALHLTFSNVSNNIFYRSRNYVIWNQHVSENPVRPDYNLAYGFDWLTNEPPIRFGEHNIFGQDPEFIENSYCLSEFSPAVDSGNPELLDPDGSRSDMGAFGGPFAYP